MTASATLRGSPQTRSLHWRDVWLPVIALTGLVIGAMLWPTAPDAARATWFVVLVGTGAVVVARTIAGVMRGVWAADIIATLAIVTAVVMGQPLAGVIVVVMQTGGEALERFAEGRASNAVRTLEADRPDSAHVLRPGAHAEGLAKGTAEQVVDVPVGQIVVGDVLMVRPGEFVPCDGVVTDGTAELDTSRLTGEPLPVVMTVGGIVRSGSINGMRAFTMRASARASESQYDRIVELVKTAQLTKAPFQRLADRYAIWFTPFTLLVAVGAGLLSGDWSRFLAVLVVATPCPLILAPPIAVIGGMNRAARRQIIVRSGGAMERLARVNMALFDKTGTLTIGTPSVDQVAACAPFTRATVLQHAASVEQGSSHLLARALIETAVTEHVSLSRPTEVVESAGQGVIGRVDGTQVAVGSRQYIDPLLTEGSRRTLATMATPGLTAYVAVDGQLAGSISYADQLRHGVQSTLMALRGLGIARMALLTGDHLTNALAVAHAVGISEVRSDLTPADKVTVLQQLAANPENAIMMVGDGTNDAPALSTAAVGIALAGHGGGALAEAADVVILVDDLDRLPDVIQISRRTMRIATESMWLGMVLSGVAMAFAAGGLIAPTIGAVLQEVIDVAAILNALRASERIHRSDRSQTRDTAGRVATPIPLPQHTPQPTPPTMQHGIPPGTPNGTTLRRARVVERPT